MFHNNHLILSRNVLSVNSNMQREGTQLTILPRLKEKAGSLLKCQLCFMKTDVYVHHSLCPALDDEGKHVLL